MLRYLWQVQKIQKSLNIKHFQKTLVVSIISSKCKNEDEKIFHEKNSIELLKIYNYFNNMAEENIKQ